MLNKHINPNIHIVLLILNKIGVMKALLIFFLTSLLWSSGQIVIDPAVSMRSSVDQDGYPPVCLIGDHEKEIDKLSAEHEKLLLSVCEDDMKVAFEKWMSMLQEMEIYADNINYNIKGLKLWLNVYWNQDGTIRHISFFPKPRSRNVDNKELIAFFKGFMKKYQFPLTSNVKFAHYGMALFPTFANNGPKVERQP